ncbi:MAG TPA: DEAD/DEAH box helicase [Dehalococcoidia bacterium]|nr:DEAD/DEAH box helicase [Dehalococcoidia bacterium]
MSTFQNFGLRPSSLNALGSMDIHTPTPIQERAIPALLEGRDVIGQASTGSGKTLAFGLPLVERVDPDERALQALVLVPTRELAQQVGAVIGALARPAGLRVALVFGGRAFGPQEEALRAGAHIVVGTPGRVMDLMRRRSMRLDGVRYLVLDEADEMLDRGFGPDVERILAATPPARQTALFSATTPEWVRRVAARHLREPLVIQIASDGDNAPDIEHVVYEVWREDKFTVLRRLLDQPSEGATLVFGRTRHGVRNLGLKLSRLGYRVDVLQGNLSQQQRDRVLRRFREGETPILVATNVAARGLDVLHIQRVINYELPETHELFTHRVGRTGRMGRAGTAITLVGPADLPKWHEIERGLGRRLPRVTADGQRVAAVPAATPSMSGARRGWRRRPRVRA